MIRSLSPCSLTWNRSELSGCWHRDSSSNKREASNLSGGLVDGDGDGASQQLKGVLDDERDYLF